METKLTTHHDKHFVYCYFNRNEPEKVQQVVPSHVDYWRSAKLKGYMGGPFEDRTGGLITFRASSLQAATEIIQKDPFAVENLIEQQWIREWLAE